MGQERKRTNSKKEAAGRLGKGDSHTNRREANAGRVQEDQPRVLPAELPGSTLPERSDELDWQCATTVVSECGGVLVGNELGRFGK